MATGAVLHEGPTENETALHDAESAALPNCA
jgi:hypothetical protein